MQKFNLDQVRKILSEAKSDNIAPIKILKKRKFRGAKFLSPRLQKLHNRLKVGPGTTKELAYCTRSQAVHTDVSDLRKNGIKIGCNYLRTTKEGRKIYLYSIG